MKLHFTSLIAFTTLTSICSATTVGFQISQVPGYFATNFSNFGATGGTNGMNWGIVVDAGGDGFAPNFYSDFSFTANQTPTTLSTSNGLSDDILYVASGLSLNSSGANETPGGAAGSNGTLLSMLSVAIDDAQLGSDFALIWFDSNEVLGGNAEIGDHYGFMDHSSLSGVDFVVPVSGTVSFADNFIGVETPTDIIRAANFTIVPEPSSIALLGLGSVALLLRRRR